MLREGEIITYEDFLSRLEGVQHHGGYCTARCPAHGDQHNSLSVSTGDKGQIIVKCHAGCSVNDIVDAMDLSTRDLFPKKNGTASKGFRLNYDDPIGGRKKAASKRWQQRGKIVASYEYRSDDGRLLAIKDRYEPKFFSWRYPDGNNGWFNGTGGQQLPLYKHECIGNPVYLVEGEKDVDTLISGGLHAVSNPNGAAEWKERHTEQLRGYDVVVIPDNDDTGKKHAHTVCEALHGVAASVKLLDLPELWESMPEHGDVTDYVKLSREAGQPEERIFKVLEAVRKSLPEYEPDQVDDLPEQSASIFKSVTDFEEQEAAWLIPGWLPEGQVTIMAADGGVGKTTLCCNIMAAISSGTECILDITMPDREPQKVLLLTTEDSIAKKLKKKLRLAGANLDNIIAPDPSADEKELLRGLKFGTKFLEQIIKQYKPALCVFDPIQGYVPPEINMGARNAMRDCLAPLVTLGEETGCTFLIICHSNKRRGASGRERVSDSSDIWDIARSVMMAGFTSESEKDVRYLSNEKNNYDKLQETVLFSIDDHGQIVHKGFSEKRDRDFRSEAHFIEKEAEPLNERLLEALKDAANPFDTVKFHYSDFEEKYGATIFGGKRPADALNLMKQPMEEEGYSLVIKQVKIEGKVSRGFSITPVGEYEQAAVCV